jgi:uncharacterized membrane protein YbhN (UPF0104 family)
MSGARASVWWRRTAQLLFVVALAFVVGAAIDVGRRLSHGQLALSLPHLALAALSFGGGYLMLSWGFGRFVAHHANPAPRAAVVAEIYFRSLLARYLPGKVAVAAVRAGAAAELGVGSTMLGASAVLEMLAWLSAGMLACALVGTVTGLPRALPGTASHVLFAVAVVGSIVVLVTLCTLDRRRYPARLLKLLRCEDGSGPIVPVALVSGAALYWVFAALCSALVALGAGGSAQAAWLAALATMASSLAGFLALPVPAGMGVREAVFVVVLGPGMGNDAALAVALITRALAIALEALLWLACLGLRWRLRRAGPDAGAPIR